MMQCYFVAVKEWMLADKNLFRDHKEQGAAVKLQLAAVAAAPPAPAAAADRN